MSGNAKGRCSTPQKECNDANAIIFWDLEFHQQIRTLLVTSSPIRAICLRSNREWIVREMVGEKAMIVTCWRRFVHLQ